MVSMVLKIVETQNITWIYICNQWSIIPIGLTTWSYAVAAGIVSFQVFKEFTKIQGANSIFFSSMQRYLIFYLLVSLFLSFFIVYYLLVPWRFHGKHEGWKKIGLFK